MSIFGEITWIEKDVIFGVEITWKACIVCGGSVFTGLPAERVLCGGKFCLVPRCEKCGYIGPSLDKHHIHGRKNSPETITLCANCHREYHLEHGYIL